jgi:hypothetical protein
MWNVSKPTKKVGMVVHTYNPSTQEGGNKKMVSSRPAWAI